MLNFVQKLLILILAWALAACALLGGGEEMPEKNTKVQFSAPTKPFSESALSGGADHVWQSEKTGNTIALNSQCIRGKDFSLPDLRKGILSGISDFKQEKNWEEDFDGVKSERTIGSGVVEGVPVRLNLVIYKKASCSYDLMYIGRTQTYSEEQNRFDDFLKGFRHHD